jgi:hypothetical protein
MFQILSSVNIKKGCTIKLFSIIPPNIETLNYDIKMREQALNVSPISLLLGRRIFLNRKQTATINRCK